MTYPLVEYAHGDPLLRVGAAVTGVVVYRSHALPQLANLVLFGDNPNGEVLAFSAVRADLRVGTSADGQVFLLNKQDGTVRRLVR